MDVSTKERGYHSSSSASSAPYSRHPGSRSIEVARIPKSKRRKQRGSPPPPPATRLSTNGRVIPIFQGFSATTPEEENKREQRHPSSSHRTRRRTESRASALISDDASSISSKNSLDKDSRGRRRHSSVAGSSTHRPYRPSRVTGGSSSVFSSCSDIRIPQRWPPISQGEQMGVTWSQLHLPLPIPYLEFLFHLEYHLAPPYNTFTNTGFFGARAQMSSMGGQFAGPKLHGEILPAGGADWIRTQDHVVKGSGGSGEWEREGVEVRTSWMDMRYALRTHDGAVIYLRTRGVRTGRREVLERIGRKRVLEAEAEDEGRDRWKKENKKKKEEEVEATEVADSAEKDMNGKMVEGKEARKEEDVEVRDADPNEEKEHVGANEYRMRLTIAAETEDERYDWLNRTVMIASAGRNGNTIVYDAYEVL
ncbi:hypothetical protein MMC25_006319 [Agyrium rufum]|nr:hypothetical protein [Agyrium rufum]